MVPDGVECVVGVVRDPVFGPVVMFGLGGVLVELMKDVSFRLAPVSEAQALAMIRETRGARLLEGFRGAPPADVPALARAIVAVSELAPLCGMKYINGENTVTFFGAVLFGQAGRPV